MRVGREREGNREEQSEEGEMGLEMRERKTGHGIFFKKNDIHEGYYSRMKTRRKFDMRGHG